MKNNSTHTTANLNSNIDKMVVTSRKVACDGPEFSKHPRIFLTLGADGEAACPYCSREFVLKPGTAEEAH